MKMCQRYKHWKQVSSPKLLDIQTHMGQDKKTLDLPIITCMEKKKGGMEQYKPPHLASFLI